MSSSPLPLSPPGSPQQPLEVGLLYEVEFVQDDDDMDVDSSLGAEMELEGSTASISASILAYRTLHGRRYHSERGAASYWGSNDERQSESMDIMHHIFTLLIGGDLHVAPLRDDIQFALDIGCGTGVWAIDFADAFPGCKVVGTDISAIQPVWLPANLSFELEDCITPWSFTHNTADYVHIRYMVGSVPDWTKLFIEAHQALKPGGWLESYEASPLIESDDGTVLPDSALGQWAHIFIEASKNNGHSFNVVPDNLQTQAMREAGFINIQELELKCPLSPWAQDRAMKELGVYGEVFATHDTEGFVLLAASQLGWTHQDIQDYIKRFRSEIKNRNIHPYFRVKIVWGQKG